MYRMFPIEIYTVSSDKIFREQCERMVRTHSTVYSIDHSWEIRDHCNYQCDITSPIPSTDESVDSLWSVELVNVDSTVFDDEEIKCHEGGDGG